MIKPIIIGGGIGGLTLALALSRRGIAAPVFEAAPALKPLGAGIIVPPNAMEALARLGAAEAVAAAGRPLRAGLLADYRSGPLQRLATGVTPTGAFPAVAIHRARLHQALCALLDPGLLRLGRALAGIEQEGGGVTARFADGSHERADCLIAADGLRSAARGALFPAAQPRYSGQSSYRSVTAFRLPAAFDHAGWEIWGPGCRFGFVAIGEGEVYWYATFEAPAGRRDEPAAIGARLAELFSAFPAPVPEIIAASDPARVLRTDLSDLPPLERWHRGRVCLLGDAAHATTPNLGQGGAQAIEDAYVLAGCLAEQPPEEAFAAYQRLRADRAALVTRRSWRLGQVAHWRNPLARAVRNALLRSVPAALASRQAAAFASLPY